MLSQKASSPLNYQLKFQTHLKKIQKFQSKLLSFPVRIRTLYVSSPEEISAQRKHLLIGQTHPLIYLRYITSVHGSWADGSRMYGSVTHPICGRLSRSSCRETSREASCSTEHFVPCSGITSPTCYWSCPGWARRRWQTAAVVNLNNGVKLVGAVETFGVFLLLVLKGRAAADALTGNRVADLYVSCPTVGIINTFF